MVLWKTLKEKLYSEENSNTREGKRKAYSSASKTGKFVLGWNHQVQVRVGIVDTAEKKIKT